MVYSFYENKWLKEDINHSQSKVKDLDEAVFIVPPTLKIKNQKAQALYAHSMGFEF